jgi:hypothetical protein
MVVIIMLNTFESVCTQTAVVIILKKNAVSVRYVIFFYVGNSFYGGRDCVENIATMYGVALCTSTEGYLDLRLQYCSFLSL